MGEEPHLKKLFILPLVLIVLVLNAGILFPVDAREKVTAKDKLITERKQKAIVPKPVDRYAIGCVLPLTGRYAASGNRALEAIILASGVFDPAVKSPVKLIIEDSKSKPETARAAVTKLAVQDGVLCILGPLGNTEAIDAAREAQKLKIPIITLTQKEKITDIGDYVFRNYMTNHMQIRRLVTYAIGDMDISRFAVLYPNDPYGREMERLFRDEVLRQGGEIRGAKFYDKTQTDFGDEIKAITRIKGTSSEGKEYRNNKDEYKPVIDFDALFIPDSPERISMILPQLAFHNIRGIKLLGAGSWNSPVLLKAGGEYLEGAIFVDGFSRNSFYPETNDFIDIFYTNYSREPDVIEALVYDATSIIIKTIEDDDIKTRDQFRDGMLRLKNYRGVTGKTSFAGARDVQKEAFVLMVKDGQVMQIK
jgi:ABC-type branched-subunit amino acid transport system substrate-binding protein